ncbi:MAG: NAD(P)-dependent glycerol-1-phosphate dehydrogenase [Thermoplasmataceae archaeon]
MMRYEMEFEKFKTMQFPRDVYVGHGVLPNIVPVVGRYMRVGSILIITGNITYNLAGKQIEEFLTDSDYSVHVIKADKADVSNLNSIEEEAKDLSVGLIIGVGGGTKIDLAKKSAFDMGVPFVSVPTSPSHDGIASPRASIRNDKLTVSQEASMPIAIIADTYILSRAPYRYLRAGAADVISNLTALLDWKLANRLHGEEYSSSAAAISEYAARELLEKSHMVMEGVEESVWLVTKQILASGTAMAIAGNSRPASGSEHLLAHALEMSNPGSSIHGEQCAMGSVVSMFLHGGEWQVLGNAYSRMGLSIRAKDYNIPDTVVIKALSTAHRIRPERYTILGEKDISTNAAEKALEITGII